MEITFAGGLAVETTIRDFTIRTDQSLDSGGENSAPTPFELFLASLGTCAGFFALRFCQERQIATDGLRLNMDWDRDPETRRLTMVRLHVHLPADFPDKYRKAITRAIDQCTVKRTVLDPPVFEVSTE